ncbi:MAG: type-F conjugative transfer system protein TraW [Maricaulaceae bacterium]
MARGIYILCLVTSLTTLSPECNAKDFGTHGSVFEITETPIFEMIRKKLAALEEAGEVDKLNEQLKQNVIKGVEAPPSVPGLMEVSEPSEFVFDPSITVARDIDDGGGNLIAQAGTVINPLDHVSLGDPLLFIMGDKPAHVSLARRLREERGGKLKVIFVSGRPLQAMRDNGFRVFFDQGGAMVSRFQISRVPALVDQEGKQLIIKEVPADDL